MRLAAETIEYAYGQTPVLGDVSVSMEPGEVLAIIGPSGAGKTTLLRLLALFERPDRGHVTFGGEDVWQAGEAARLAYRRRLGMVFQEARLFDGSVQRNVEYGLRVRREWAARLRQELETRLGVGEDSERVREALELVGLEGSCEQAATKLSGGEAQRVAFARAIAYEPDALLLDEPTSELDPRNTAVIEKAVRAAAAREMGVAIATHDMHQAERVADQVAVLLGGEIIESGSVSRVFTDPMDERTRRFIDGELVYP